VAVSAVLVLGSGIALVVWGLATQRQRVTSFAVEGSLNTVVLDLADADVTVARGRQDAMVRVRSDDRSTFGHRATSSRRIAGTVLRIRSRCPTTVLHTCSASYRVEVPDNVSVDVRTSSGGVALRGYRGRARVSTRGGNIDVEGFCGFLLQASAQSGNVLARTVCAPEQLSLRSSSGSVHAEVPGGRYQLDAESASGTREVRGVTAANDSPFAIQAFSSSGDVVVERTP
jgi:DUF4097 and DUF4098 domain-containing protein YvlB